jgi:cysteine desulfurase
VLDAMRVEAELASCALRATFGWNSTVEDINAATSSLLKLRERIRAREAA